MKVVFSSKSAKQFKRIPPNHQKKIKSKLYFLERDPHLGKMLKGELRGFRSLKVWPYRVVYRIEGKLIVVHSVAHRKSVYNI